MFLQFFLHRHTNLLLVVIENIVKIENATFPKEISVQWISLCQIPSIWRKSPIETCFLWIWLLENVFFSFRFSHMTHRAQMLMKSRLAGAQKGHGLLKKKADALQMRFRQILGKIIEVSLKLRL